MGFFSIFKVATTTGVNRVGVDANGAHYLLDVDRAVEELRHCASRAFRVTPERVVFHTLQAVTIYSGVRKLYVNMRSDPILTNDNESLKCALDRGCFLRSPIDEDESRGGQIAVRILPENDGDVEIVRQFNAAEESIACGRAGAVEVADDSDDCRCSDESISSGRHEDNVGKAASLTADEIEVLTAAMRNNNGDSSQVTSEWDRIVRRATKRRRREHGDLNSVEDDEGNRAGREAEFTRQDDPAGTAEATDDTASSIQNDSDSTRVEDQAAVSAPEASGGVEAGEQAQPGGDGEDGGEDQSAAVVVADVEAEAEAYAQPRGDGQDDGVTEVAAGVGADPYAGAKDSATAARPQAEAEARAAIRAPATPDRPFSQLPGWLRQLDAAGGIFGRYEAYAPAFGREFGTLEALALAVDQDGVDAIFEDCGVVARGDRAHLTFEIGKLERPE